MKWVETSSPYGTSGSNSTGKPRKPLKRSKVTCATCLTLEGKPISMEEGSQLLLLYLLQPIKDFLNATTKSAKMDTWSSPSLSFSIFIFKSPSSSSSFACIILQRGTTSVGTRVATLNGRAWGWRREVRLGLDLEHFGNNNVLFCFDMQVLEHVVLVMFVLCVDVY